MRKKNMDIINEKCEGVQGFTRGTCTNIATFEIMGLDHKGGESIPTWLCPECLEIAKKEFPEGDTSIMKKYPLCWRPLGNKQSTFIDLDENEYEYSFELVHTQEDNYCESCGVLITDDNRGCMVDPNDTSKEYCVNCSKQVEFE